MLTFRRKSKSLTSSIAPLVIALLAFGAGVIATRASHTQTGESSLYGTSSAVMFSQRQLFPPLRFRSPRNDSRPSGLRYSQSSCLPPFEPCTSSDQCCSGICRVEGAGTVKRCF